MMGDIQIYTSYGAWLLDSTLLEKSISFEIDFVTLAHTYIHTILQGIFLQILFTEFTKA